MTKLRQGLSLALCVVSLSACETSSLAPPEDAPGIVQAVHLERAASCEALASSIHEQLIRQQRIRTYEAKHWFDEQSEYISASGGSDLGAAIADGGASGGTSSGTGGPSDFTTTNTQVEGVDEPDFMKNDGTRVVLLRNGTLYTARSWPPESLAVVGQVEVGSSWNGSMFLAGDRAVVLSGDYYSSASTTITVVDVSDLAQPRIASRTSLPGNLVGARRVGSSVRVVQSGAISLALEYLPSSYDTTSWRRRDRAEYFADLDAVLARNTATIRATPLQQLLPEGKLEANGEEITLPYRCEDVYLSNAPSELGTVTVSTLDLDHPERPPARVTALVHGWQLYATADSLYVAAPHWWWWSAWSRTDQAWTYLHKFDLSDASRPRYAASGGIAGTLLNQFAMDEHEGRLRVAATERRWTSSSTTSFAPPTIEARVSVLQQSGQALTRIGATEPLAKGESITAVRFMGTRGLVVTFLQTDPFYTLDLSDPRAPRVSGELKVPGFSAYLHPLDATHVVGLGTYVPDPSEGPVDWRERRVKLSVYDVSDFDNPKEQQTLLIGSTYGWTDATWDHHAFSWFAPRRLLAIPFADQRYDAYDERYWSGFTSEIRLYRYDPATGFAPAGAMSLEDLYASGTPRWSYWYGPQARRSIMATAEDGTDYLYGISDAGLRVAEVAAPAIPLATALLP